MAKYAWATDIHLDFLSDDPGRIIEFAQSLIVGDPDGVLLTGDISVANTLVLHLSMIEKVVQRPIYFVLGNHDYYGASTERVRASMHELGNVSSFLRYMPTMPYYGLTPATAVVGHDGWYDAFHGDWQNSGFAMTDWHTVHDFANVNSNRATIVSVARKLAYDAVLHVQNAIKQATRYHKNVIVLTHFPPFREAHVHAGRPGSPGHVPWYTSKMMGDMLLQASTAYPTHRFTVLCGHTHGRWSGSITSNLTVHVGGAEYDRPQPQSLVEIA